MPPLIPAAKTFRAPLRRNAERLPVTVITGFLGSGKTTLVNRILGDQPGVRTAVLANDFGEINLDGGSIVSRDGRIIEISNGCICCSVQDDLLDGLVDVLARSPEIDRILIETSGIADPLPVALTVLRSEFRTALRLDAIIAMADAEQFSLDLFDDAAVRSQLRHADVVLLNKCDLVQGGRIAELTAEVRKINPQVRLIETVRGDVPLPLILDVRAFAAGQRFTAWEEDNVAHSGGVGFQSIFYESPRPFALERFQDFLDEGRPEGIFRAKGFLSIVNKDPLFFHLVGQRFTLDPSPFDASDNRLIFIGRDFDGFALRATLDACLA